MNCPKCNHKNKDDALFCDECGESLKIQASNLCPSCNSENSNGAKFCNKCGFSLEIPKETKEKNIEKQKEISTSNAKKERSWFWEALRKMLLLVFALASLAFLTDGMFTSAIFSILIVIILLVPCGRRIPIVRIVLIFFLMSMIGDADPSSTISTNSNMELNDNSDLIYSQSPSEMVLTVNDMPEGWSRDTYAIKDNCAESGFHKVAYIMALKVNCNVTKYPSILDAKSQYQTMCNKESSTTSLGHPSVGDEAYEKKIDVGAGLDTIVFRKGNIIAQVRCVGVDSIDFAEIVDEKINN